MEFIRLADRMEHVHSDIRGELFHKAMRMQAEGIEVLKLNTGNPAAFGFPLPESIRAALSGRESEAVAYCDFQGMPAARQAIAAYARSKGIEGVQPEDVFIGNGVSEVVNFALLPLLNPGDEVLIPTPNYSLWSNTVLLTGAKPVFYRCDEAAGWNPDVADLRSRITPKTKAMVIINPNNPTGVLYDTDILRQMLDVAREHDLVVFSDEIYDRLVMDGLKHVSTASLAPDLTVVTLNGLSKSHILCGYRCGWMVLSGPRARTEEYRKGLVQLTSLRLCSNALAQLVVPAALNDMETPTAMVSPGGRMYEQRQATIEELDKIDGISYVKNNASFYLFPKLDVKKFNITNDKKFAGDLLDAAHILVVPGSGFDWPEPDHFRLVLLPEPQQLRAAMRRLGEFLDGYRQA
ncbi:MAG: aminotransferase class I/II-fold pyridoxal phosphate-dependent enzyme [Oscillospiraceae bacterium]|nr:aminotransferase class I/II-fold pyridoxal phosphate-dependent enzyme [Oscillospiraceae bacterium]